MFIVFDVTSTLSTHKFKSLSLQKGVPDPAMRQTHKEWVGETNLERLLDNILLERPLDNQWASWPSQPEWLSFTRLSITFPLICFYQGDSTEYTYSSPCTHKLTNITTYKTLRICSLLHKLNLRTILFGDRKTRLFNSNKGMNSTSSRSFIITCYEQHNQSELNLLLCDILISLRWPSEYCTKYFWQCNIYCNTVGNFLIQNWFICFLCAMLLKYKVLVIRILLMLYKMLNLYC